MNPSEQQLRSLRGYLRKRSIILKQIRSDFPVVSWMIRPRDDGAEVDDGPGAPRAWIAVDWSEVFEYIFLGSDEESLHSEFQFLRPGTVRGARLAAASFLFNEVNAPCVLLPPYVAEMRTFLDQLWSNAIDDRKTEDTVNQAIYELTEKNEGLEKSVRYIRSLIDFEGAGVPSELDVDRLLEDLDATHREHLLELVQGDFAELYLYVHVAAEARAAKRLDQLFVTTGEQPHGAPLQGLADQDARIAASVQKATLPVHQSSFKIWRDRLKQHALDRAVISLDYDAHALVYLEMLNVELHERGTYLFFVSRDKALQKVMEGSPGSFGVLDDRASERQINREPDTLIRSLDYWLELGRLRWTGNGHGDLSELLDEELKATDDWLHEFTAGDAAEAITMKTQSLIEHIDNSWSVFAGRSSQWQSWSGASPEDCQLRDIVKAITDSRSFEEERRSLLKSVARTMQRWSVLAGQTADSNAWAMRFGDYQQTWVSVLDKIGVERFVEVHKDPRVRRYHWKILRRQLEVADTLPDRAPARKGMLDEELLRELERGPAKDKRLGQFVQMTMHFVLEEYLSAARLARQLAKTKRLPIEVYVACQLIAADCELFQSTYGVTAANETLTKLLDHLKRVNAPIDLWVTTLMARLVLHLDRLDEAEGIRQRDGQGATSETYGYERVAEALEELIELEDSPRTSKNSRLALSFDNHVVYAAARLIGGNHKLSKNLTRGLATRIERLTKLASKVLPSKGDASIPSDDVKVLDTLLFYYCMKALTVPTDKTVHIHSAHRIYKKLRKLDEDSLGMRARRALRRHCEQYEGLIASRA